MKDHTRTTLPSDGRLPPASLEVKRCYAGDRIYVRLLDGADFGCQTHYIDKQGVYCPGETCPPAHHREKLVWKGYRPAEWWLEKDEVWRPCVLELTSVLWVDTMDCRTERGQVWELWRHKRPKGKPAPVEGTLLEVVDGRKIPAPFDMLPTLLRLYGVGAINLNIRCPLQSRQKIECSVGDPPPGVARRSDNTTRPAAEDEHAQARWQRFKREVGFAGKPATSDNGNGEGDGH